MSERRSCTATWKTEGGMRQCGCLLDKGHEGEHVCVCGPQSGTCAPPPAHPPEGSQPRAWVLSPGGVAERAAPLSPPPVPGPNPPDAWKCPTCGFIATGERAMMLHEHQVRFVPAAHPPEGSPEMRCERCSLTRPARAMTTAGCPDCGGNLVYLAPPTPPPGQERACEGIRVESWIGGAAQREHCPGCTPLPSDCVSGNQGEMERTGREAICSTHALAVLVCHVNDGRPCSDYLRPPTPGPGQDREARLEAARLSTCGQHPTLGDVTRQGSRACGRILSVADLYRCADCRTAFCRGCIRRHFADKAREGEHWEYENKIAADFEGPKP